MSVSEILSLCNIFATVIVVIVGFLCNLILAKMQKQSENSVYVAKIAFDMYMKMFDDISVSMFNTYNCLYQAFYGYEEKRVSIDERARQRLSLSREITNWLNQFIISYSTKKYLLNVDMCDKLDRFEHSARQLTSKLENNWAKIYPAELTEEDRKEWAKNLAEIETMKDLYNEIMVQCRDYMGQLQKV